jgi:hypothetical protein
MTADSLMTTREPKPTTASPTSPLTVMVPPMAMTLRRTLPEMTALPPSVKTLSWVSPAATVTSLWMVIP